MRSLLLAGLLVATSSSAADDALREAARQAWLLAFARGGDATQARAKIAEIAARPGDVRGLEAKLAGLFADLGKDREAMLLWRELIAEAPRAPEAALFQAQVVEAELRRGSRADTSAAVEELVATFQRVGPSTDPAVIDARELAERELSALAVAWHRERPDVDVAAAHAATDRVYGAYLTLFPAGAKSYALRFFWAEFLYDQVHAFELAAEQYTAVLMDDVKAQESGAAPGRFMEKAAFNAVLAREQVVAQVALRR